MTPDPVTTNHFRDLCAQYGTERQVAAALHVTRSSVAKWRSGKHEVSWAAAELLRRIIEDSHNVFTQKMQRDLECIATKTELLLSEIVGRKTARRNDEKDQLHLDESILKWHQEPKG